MRSVFVLCLLSVPSAAAACGMLACDSASPVTQAAERILFAPGERDGTLQMHVQVTWAGPPEEFGWLLPVPADVESGISPPAIFQSLDRLYTPTFRLWRDCGFDGVDGEGGMGGAGGQGGAGGGGGGVAILSRSEVGPYDQVVLRAEAAGELLDWLDGNGFNPPAGTGAILQDYLDQGAAVLALKLLPDEGVEDIAPLWLEFTADQPTIPIRPTGLAAQPDMGVIVHLVGDARAVPTNYLHVEINEGAIDWFDRGRNYPDVVGQAVDEAGGLAFATDFAGPLNWRALRVQPGLEIYPADRLADIAEADTFGVLMQRIFRVAPAIDPPLAAILTALVEPPDGVTHDDMLSNPWSFEALPVNGGPIAARIAAELNPPRQRVARVFDREGWLTRLYTTLSPAEMQRDPLFDFNPDLEPVSQLRQARFRGQMSCDDGVLTLEDGREYVIRDGERGGRVVRQNGVTVRGNLTPAAAQIERHFPVGQPEMIAEMPKQPSDPVALTPAGQDGEAGCGGCDTQNSAPTLPLLLLGLLALRARRLAP